MTQIRYGQGPPCYMKLCNNHIYSCICTNITDMPSLFWSMTYFLRNVSQPRKWPINTTRIHKWHNYHTDRQTAAKYNVKTKCTCWTDLPRNVVGSFLRPCCTTPPRSVTMLSSFCIILVLPWPMPSPSTKGSGLRQHQNESWVQQNLHCEGNQEGFKSSWYGKVMCGFVWGEGKRKKEREGGSHSNYTWGSIKNWPA